MRYKCALLAMLISMMLVAPAFAFWHPPPPPPDRPPCPYFGVLINNEWALQSDPYEFVEPGLYCTKFKVTVGIFNVSDLYGYEFVLHWDKTYFSLVGGPVIEKNWDPMQIYLNKSVAPNAWKVVASGMDPAPGLPKGDYKLAEFTFHIDNDVCWLQGNLTWPDVDAFWVDGLKASDSCSQPIDLCNPIHAFVKLVPVEPEVYILPPSINNSKIHDKFTVSVVIENIVKMKDLHFWVLWRGYYVAYEDFYSALLCTKKADIVINEDVFPKAKRVVDILNVVSPNCSIRHVTNDYGDASGYVELNIDMDCKVPPINGTFWVMNITFEKCDPWFCGAQPGYTPKGDHDWLLDWAETDIFLYSESTISVLCFDLDTMHAYEDFSVENSHYIFKPIPGDLNGDGHVDIKDLMIEAGYYGMGWNEPGAKWPEDYYYDLNKDGYIDIYDLVIVAKNICRTTPSDP